MSAYQWDFGSTEAGLQFKVVYDGTNFTVTCLSGFLDLNALWLSDGDRTVDGLTTLAKSDNSLNMNGTGIVWDDYYKLSNTGLGMEGQSKPTFLTEGESYSFAFSTADLKTGFNITNAASWTVGIRATSTSAIGSDGIKWVDTTAQEIITNHAASISVTAGGDYDITENGGLANGTVGDPSASGNLGISDVDNGENKFQTPASLAGTYGDFSFNAATGDWTYTLDQTKADPLTAGQKVNDIMTVQSYDGTATQDIVVNITGANDNATINVTAGSDYDVVENGGLANDMIGDPSASGNLGISDVDNGEDKFQTPASLAGTYGDFTFNATTGDWTYSLDQTKADPLTAGQKVNDTMTVQSYDGTATQDIVVNITGANDAPVFTSNTTIGTISEHLINSTYNGFNTKNVGTVSATDVDSGDLLSYSITSDSSSGAFKIDTSTGQLSVRDISLLDYEGSGLSSDDGGKYYSLTLNVSDGQLTTSQSAKVYLTDIINTSTSSAADYIDGNGSADMFIPKQGGINLGDGNDVAFGDGGSDTIWGQGGNDWLFGGTGGDTLEGKDGMDILYGGTESDTLTGNGGADLFVFGSGSLSGTADIITDFKVADNDKILLINDYQGLFTALPDGTLAQTAFAAAAGMTSATTIDQRIFENTNTGALYYDADGSNSGFAAIQFTTLGTNSHPTLSATDFIVGLPPGPTT